MTATAGPARKFAIDTDRWTLLGLVAAYLLYLSITVLAPLALILSRSLHDASGRFVGIANYAAYFSSPTLLESAANSLLVAATTTVIVVAMAFSYAYGLTRTCMPAKAYFRIMAMAPLLMPGLLKAIALIYWFGNQGVLKSWLFGHSIYGPIGIVMASVLWTLPHAIMLLSAALMLSDARLFEAAESLKAGKLRIFRHVTLPGIRYGLVSTAIFVFVKVLTEFGIPKVIGGQYNVLATDIYKEVVGQQNFEMGAVVSIILLAPALAAFAIDRSIASRQAASLTARSVPYAPKPSRWIDTGLFIYCAAVTIAMLAVLGMGQFAALVRFWPYNLELTLAHYSFDMEGVGWENFFNSLALATCVATIGTILTFVGAYVVEKPRELRGLRQLIQAIALLPMAVPGLVLGLGYLLFVNRPGSVFNVFYGTLAILVVNTMTHYYTVTHLTALTALKQIDREFESVAASLKVPMVRSFWRITVPICAPALLEIWSYLFLNAITTLSGAIFLYGVHTKLASIAVVHMDEAGRLASAAAMGTLIVYACIVVRLLHSVIANYILRQVQAWRGSSRNA